MNWQPIATAPIEPFDKEFWYRPHSPRLLVWCGRWAEIATYDYTERGKGRWLDVTGRVTKPTHWMPLPNAPKESE